MQMNKFCSWNFVSKMAFNNESCRLAPRSCPSNAIFGYGTKKGRVPCILVRAGKGETVRVIRQQTRVTDRRHVRKISPCTRTSCSRLTIYDYAILLHGCSVITGEWIGGWEGRTFSMQEISKNEWKADSHMERSDESVENYKLCRLVLI